MSYWREKDGLKYQYGTVEGKKDQLIKPLGNITKTEATALCAQWDIDNGRDKFNLSRRSMESVWQDFMRHLIRSRRKPNTIHCYEECVYPFVQTIKTIRDLEDGLKAYNQKLLSHTWGKKNQFILSQETYRHRMATIRAFLGWMAREGIIKKSPFNIRLPKPRQDAGRALTPLEVITLFEKWPQSKRPQFQENNAAAKVFFLIMYFAGTRVTEILGKPEDPENYPGLLHENIDRHRCVLLLTATKAGESREVACPRSVIDAIPFGTGPVFRTLLTYSGVYAYYRVARKAAGITGRLRPYDGRVSAATAWAKLNPGQSKSMQDQFGWKSSKMADHYNKVATDWRIDQAQRMDYHRLLPPKSTAESTASTAIPTSSMINNGADYTTVTNVTDATLANNELKNQQTLGQIDGEILQ